MPMNSENYWKEFRDKLSELGALKGGIIYVGSDITGLIVQAQKELGIKTRDERNAYINELIDALKEQVTEEGTLLFPVYSWDFCRGKGFDIRKTQGEVGALNNFVLNERSDFRRTKHPIYSFMVWGRDADLLCDMNNQEAWGPASPFKYLHENNAIELDLNVTALRSMTFKHYVEQSVRVPYRYPKYFMGRYTDENGITEERTYSMYVRDLSVELESSQTNEFFNAGGAGKQVLFRNLNLYAIDLGRAYELLKDDLLTNNGRNVYSFENYTIDWNDTAARYEIGFWKDKKIVSIPEGIE